MTKILFDTDPGIDDAMALYLLARDPRAELVGITTVFGNASIDTTTRNALALRERFGLRGVPVARGAARALVKPSEGFADFVHGQDGLGDAGTAPASSGHDTLDGRAAALFIIEMARRYSGELVLVPVGPLTNIAHALQLDPELPRHVRGVVLMGGAFGTLGHGGNMSPVAEANIHGDPHAADLVATADWPVTFVGLDVTHQVRMSTAYLDEIGREGGDHGRYLRDITRFYERFYAPRTGGGIYSHDASAVACALDPGLFTLRHGPVRVVTDGIACGQTVQRLPGRPDPSPHWDSLRDQAVCVDVDSERVLREYRALF
jgi:purine nucleosidase